VPNFHIKRAIHTSVSIKMRTSVSNAAKSGDFQKQKQDNYMLIVPSY